MQGDTTLTARSWLDRLPLLLTLIVALAAAILAAGHTVEMVRVTTGSTGWLPWLVPITLEGAALSTTVLAAARHRVGLSARYETAVVVAILGLAVAVNASAASGPWPGEGVVLSAAPPLVLALAVHGLVRARDVSVVRAERAEAERVERERAAERKAERERRARGARTAHAQQPTSKASTSRPAMAPLPPEAATTSARDSIEETTSAVEPFDVSSLDTWLAQDPSLTGKRIGERYGLSEATGRRRLSEAKARAARAA